MALIPAPIILSKCPVKQDASPIILEIIVGNAQLNQGSFSVKRTISSPASIQGELRSGEPVIIGSGPELAGQRLSVLVTVATIQSVDTTLTFKLSEGTTNINITNSTQANAIGDVVVYEAYIRFTNS
ncbi:MAG: hypothetical protein ACKV1O_07780 [Saprospiraceae bacterium]